MRRAEQIPGPSEYDVPQNPLPKGGKLNQDTNGKTWLDKIAMVASETPGSSDYRPKCMTFQSGGGRFSTAKPKNHVERLIYNKKDIPGPGKYGNPALPKSSTGRFNESRALSEVDLLMLRSAESPAPGDYNPRYQPPHNAQQFSTANPKSGLETAIHEAKKLPGKMKFIFFIFF